MTRNKKSPAVSSVTVPIAPELGCFNCDQTHFATVYSTVEKDECQIWLTESAQLLASVSSASLASKGQGIVRYSALTWLLSSTTPTANLLLVGATTGDLFTVSPTTGTVQRTFDSPLKAKVTAMTACSDASNIVYVSHDNGWIVKWNMHSGQVEKKWNSGKPSISKLCLSPDHGLLLSAYESSLTLWNASTRKATHTFHPHVTDVKQVLFHPKDPSLMATLAKNDRVVTLWKLHNSKESAVFSCSMECNVQDFAFDTTGSTDRLLLLGELGSVHVWELKTSSSQQKKGSGSLPEEQSWSGACVCQIRLTHATTAEPLSIFAAQFSMHGDVALQLVYGQLARQPVFEVVSYYDAKGKKPLGSVSLARSTPKGLHEETKKTSRSTPDLPLTVPTAAQPHNVQGPGNTAAVPDMKSTMPADLAALASQGVSFEEALKRLQPTTTLMNGGSAVSKRLSKKKDQSESMALKANSASTVLVQALHTQDKVLLESILSTKDVDLIERTLQRLPVSYVLPLLTQIVGRFQAKPNRAAGLLPWIRSALVIHATLLMSMPDLPSKLAGLYQTLEARMSSHRKLLELNGRLDLVLSQIATRSQLAKTHSSLQEEQESPLQVYREENENQENKLDEQSEDESESNCSSESEGEGESESESEEDTDADANEQSDDAMGQNSDSEIEYTTENEDMEEQDDDRMHD